MAKLYAEINSDKGGRRVHKGGEKEVIVRLYKGNCLAFIIEHLGETIVIYNDKGHRIGESTIYTIPKDINDTIKANSAAQ